MRQGSKGFTDEKPFVVTEEDTKLPWSGHKDGSCFRCTLCGNYLLRGMVVRWIFLNKKGRMIPGMGNAFVCYSCDGEDILKKLRIHAEKAKAYWWIRK